MKIKIIITLLITLIAAALFAVKYTPKTESTAHKSVTRSIGPDTLPTNNNKW